MIDYRELTKEEYNEEPWVRDYEDGPAFIARNVPYSDPKLPEAHVAKIIADRNGLEVQLYHQSDTETEMIDWWLSVGNGIQTAESRDEAKATLDLLEAPLTPEQLYRNWFII